MTVAPLPFAPAARDLPGVLFNAADLAGRPVPERQWLVPDMIPAGKVATLSGDGGTGKSLIALQLAVAVATGGHWLGRETADGPVLFITAEDDRDELHHRLARIAGAEHLDLGDVGNLTVWSLVGADALMVLVGADGVLVPMPLLATLEAQLVRNPATLLVLDTLADLFGGNENGRTEARQFVQLLAGLAQRHECTVLLLAHPSLSGLNSGSGTSGSTAWSNSVRSRLYLERVKAGGAEPDTDARLLKVMKSNYGPTDREIPIRWQDGVFVPDDRDGGTLDRMARNAKAGRVFMALLREFATQGRKVRSSTGHGYAPSEFSRSGRAEGCSKQMLADAMERPFANGKIRLQESGPPSRKTRRIIEVS